jgi:hypothetical protein
MDPSNVRASVWFVCDHKTGAVEIRKIRYDGVDYRNIQIAHRYRERIGRTLRHIYCVTSDSKYFKLALNTESLEWTVEQIHDKDEI